jgi:chemotaxis protein MotB
VARKKKHHEDHVNHEAWAIPYADLMTLLLAFFVVMYAVSVVNEGKYRVMSESIIEAFNGSSHVIAPMPQSRVQPHNVDPAVRSSQFSEQRNLELIRDQVQRALQPLIDKQMVIVRKTTSWLEIELRTDILFSSGVARISPEANGVLNEMAAILKPFPNPVRVEGYTDDRPINTSLYPSNWELSAARAASVARLFSEQGVDPQRLGIVGWSEYRPSADNDTEDGRNHNRRVLIVVLSDDNAPKRFYNDAAHMGQLVDNDSAAPANAASVAALPQPKAPAVTSDEVPINKVVLAKPVRETSQVDEDVTPPMPAPRTAMPDGAITSTAPRAGRPEHGP